MRKKLSALALLMALLLTCTGCSLLEREWYEVTPHSSAFYEGEGRDVLRADTYQDLVNDILLLVGNHSEEGTIWLYYAQEGLDAGEAAEKACREVEEDTPMGAYAVSYIQFTVDDTARNYSEIAVTIGYQRTEQQIVDVAHATNVAALEDLLTEAARSGKTELAVQFSSYEGSAQQVQQIVNRVQTAQNGSGWMVNYYPNTTNIGVVEILMR